MDCPACSAPMVVFGVPPEHREHVPEEAPAAALCPECLTLAPAAADEATDDPAFDRVSRAFPTDDEAAVPVALAVGLLESLALHRRSIAVLLAAAERAGVDPLLVLDRLDAQGAVDPGYDIARRRHQLEQLLE